MSQEALEEAWLKTCADADYTPERDVHLYVIPGKAVDDQRAIHIEPGSRVKWDARFPFDKGQRDHANADSNRKLPRGPPWLSLSRPPRGLRFPSHES